MPGVGALGTMGVLVSGTCVIGHMHLLGLAMTISICQNEVGDNKEINNDKNVCIGLVETN